MLLPPQKGSTSRHGIGDVQRLTVTQHLYRDESRWIFQKTNHSIWGDDSIWGDGSIVKMKELARGT